MPDPSESREPLNLFDLTPTEVEQSVVAMGLPKFRGKQLLDWVYAKGVGDPQAMTNLSIGDRKNVAGRFLFSTGRIVKEQHSTDGTIKLLIEWPDGSNAETVMIPDGPRRTACVSSQVGCPVGCKFCASGLEGVKGNLRAGQIVEQVWMLNAVMAREGSGFSVQGSAEGVVPHGSSAIASHQKAEPSAPNRPRITNIVFMGMGEPLSNYANVMGAVRTLHDPGCFNLGARRITISTVGVPPRIRQLADENLPLNLALSLHAPTEPLRKQLIPWAEHFSIDEILDACRYYFDKTGREITLEYILLSAVNDQPEHARQLARVCRTIRANVNLIRYNEVSSLPFRRPIARDVVAFQQILRNAGVNAHVRKSRGRDIDAACGQLRRKEARQHLVQLGAEAGNG